MPTERSLTQTADGTFVLISILVVTVCRYVDAFCVVWEQPTTTIAQANRITIRDFKFLHIGLVVLSRYCFMLTIQSLLPAVRRPTATGLIESKFKSAGLILGQLGANCPIRTTYICVIRFTYNTGRARHGNEPVTSSSGERRSPTGASSNSSSSSLDGSRAW